MRWSVLILLIATLAAVEAPPAPEALPDTVLLDQAVRYVNQDILTLGDILERGYQHAREAARRGENVQRSRENLLRLYRDALEELTDEALLLQFAVERKVSLDPSRVTQEVLDQARKRGRTLTVFEQAQDRKAIERRERIRAVLQFFDDRTAQISPENCARYYRDHPEVSRRIARSHVYQIVLRPTDAAETVAVSKALGELLRAAQDATDGPVKTWCDETLPPYLAAEADAKAPLLIAAARRLAALAQPADAGGPALALVAADLVLRIDALKNRAAVEAELQTLRNELEGKGTDAFIAAAKARSQGPRKEQGGDMGWRDLEAGVFEKTFEEHVFSLRSNELSTVFWIADDNSAYLVLVAERQDAGQRTFAETSGQIERTLDTLRQRAIRAQAAEILRGKASIRDLADLAELMR